MWRKRSLEMIRGKKKKARDPVSWDPTEASFRLNETPQAIIIQTNRRTTHQAQPGFQKHKQ